MSGSIERICSNGTNKTRSVRAYGDILLFDLPFPRQLTRRMSYFSLLWNVQKSGESINYLACILLVCWLNLPHMELSKSLPRASYPDLLPMQSLSNKMPSSRRKRSRCSWFLGPRARSQGFSPPRRQAGKDPGIGWSRDFQTPRKLIVIN